MTAERIGTSTTTSTPASSSEAAQHDVSTRWQMYQYLAERKGPAA